MSGLPDWISACSSAKNFSAISRGKKSKSVLPMSSFGLDAHAIGHQLVAGREAAVRVLGVDEGRDQVDHGAQDIALVGERVLQVAALATGVRAFAVGVDSFGILGRLLTQLRNGGNP